MRRTWGDDGPQVGRQAATLMGLGAFVTLEIVAARLYPGGSWYDRHSVGYSLSKNFFCDLTTSIALNGAANPAAPFAQAAMVVFAVATIPFWWSLSAFAPCSRTRRLVAASGTVSGLIALTVPFLPSLEVGAVHGAVSLLAGTIGLFAGAMGIVGAIRRRAVAVALLGVSTFGATALVSGFYAATLALHADTSALPAAQKVAAVLFALWMIAASRVPRGLLRSGLAPDGASWANETATRSASSIME